MIRLLLTALTALVFGISVAQEKKLTQQEKWEQKVENYVRKDAANFPGKGLAVFTGSSSVENWKSLQLDFPDKKVLNRGLSGTKITDLDQFIDRVITPYRPKQIFLYIGDNDIGYRHAPDTILRDFTSLFLKIRKKNKKAEIVYMAIKPSPVRMKSLPEIERTNALIRNFLKLQERTAYADTFTPLLTADGQISPEHYRPDGLHMTADGYRIWAEAIRPFLYTETDMR